LGSLRKFRVFLLSGLVLMVFSAQLVSILSGAVLLLVIGVPMTIYAAAMLLGCPPRLPGRPGPGQNAAMGGIAGFFGGISGVWGPPTVALLTTMETEKTEQMRVQGVIYGSGAVALALSHIPSGVFNFQTAPMSALLVLPASIGLWIGFRIQDRIDQVTFRRLTLFVLLIAGMNLIRRGLLTF